MVRSWIEELQAQLVKQFGSKKGTALSQKYAHAFSTSYHEDCSIQSAIEDIIQMELLSEENPIDITIHDEKKSIENRFHLKLYQLSNPIPLSDTLPMLENMGLRTFSDHPYAVTFPKGSTIWISDFNVSYANATKLDLTKIKDKFRDAFIKTRFGICENDGFNKLVLGADLSWREISILRAYSKYLVQTNFRFSQAYIEKTLANYPAITRDLISLFKTKFDPERKSSPKKIADLENKIKHNLELVTSLDEDRILRRFWILIQATLRTNYFQTTKQGQNKDYLSLKLESHKIPELPLPIPLYEIFVYSPRFEGIHLRNAKVARGGIRWSDRREDFRTEVLGLMKAQKVKNAVIVPSGAKGGFVLKALQPQANREMIQTEVVNCYKSFISGLLDLTDNLKNNKVIRPAQVICYDDDDPYLVVAADKGTASFSDIANSISEEYDFWLGDAFASGGSTGYDHKKMGITARGAWESIKRHFRELNINYEQTEFTVVGIGDMSGDVFGNGMLYSSNIKLIAAFDHRHIFIDPNPDAKKSLQERLRLFNLPTSSWEDYNPKLISQGGEVYKRTSKSITLSPEAKTALNIEEDTLAPNELIRAILKAPVDLLFNGGIGTYVKASTESHADVGDKTNEFCRINGEELRCKIVGEGGNLGFTQLGRVEYALQGGLIFTDFIDNSAGVDCSDHEVNIKILLDKEVKKGKLTENKRNNLLASMTQDVAYLVLQDNYNQALAMSFSANHSAKLSGLYQIYLRELELSGIINRAVEFLPDDKKFLERKAAGLGLTRPELAVLLAYTKIHIKNEILKSDVPEDPYLGCMLQNAFPTTLNKTYRTALEEHPLRREIIATQLSNQVVNEMGITFVYRLQTETGAIVSDIIRAHTVANHIFAIKELQTLVDSLSFKISSAMQYELLHYIRTLINLASRWFLHSNRLKGDLTKIISHYAERVSSLEEMLPNLMSGETKIFLDTLVEHFEQAGIPKDFARRFATTRAIYTSLNVIEVATKYRFDLFKTARVYFNVGSRFNLVWFRDQIASDSREGHWNTLARLTLRDELDYLQKALTVGVMQINKKEADPQSLIEYWAAKNTRAVERWDKILSLLHGSTSIEYSMFFIALREFAGCVNASMTE